MKYTHRRAIACLMLLVLGACGTGGQKAPYPGTKVGKPYEIYGRWYEPGYNAHYDETGIASWYGPGFHGGKTASGERFNENDLTAAHRTLPLPSIVRVTNLDNGLSAIIKVNDRGPFSHDRIIDLSRGSAQKLGVIRTGTAHVRVQFLDHETREYVKNLQNNGTQYAMHELKSVNSDQASANEEARPKQPLSPEEGRVFADNTATQAHAQGVPFPPMQVHEPSQEQLVPGGNDEFSVLDNSGATSPPARQQAQYQPAAVPGGPIVQSGEANIFVQAGTFSLQSNALALVDRLSGEDTPQIMEVILKGKMYYRVMVGPYETRDDAKNMLSKLASIGMPDAKIIRN